MTWHGLKRIDRDGWCRQSGQMLGALSDGPLQTRPMDGRAQCPDCGRWLKTRRHPSSVRHAWPRHKHPDV